MQQKQISKLQPVLIHQNFPKKLDLAISKISVNKLDIYKLKKVPNNLSNLKSRVDKLDLAKLLPVPVYLSKLSDVVN